MKMSENIEALATALSQAQAKIVDPEMDGTNPHFESKFATLTGLLKKIRPSFAEFGLSISQIPDTNENGVPALVTIVMHKSGQWISGRLELLIGKRDMQGLGAALTYAKRQAAGAMAGVSAEQDDDGEGAIPPRQQPKQNNPKPDPKRAAPKVTFMTDPRIKMLYAVTKEAGWTEKQLRDFVKQQFGYDSNRLFTKDQFELLIAHLKNKPSPVAEILNDRTKK